eukprot:jgi/Mesen1/2845/ME000174S02096
MASSSPILALCIYVCLLTGAQYAQAQQGGKPGPQGGKPGPGKPGSPPVGRPGPSGRRVGARNNGTIILGALLKQIQSNSFDAKRYSIFASLLNQASLAPLITNGGKLTILAPTNAAFAKLPKGALDRLKKDRAALGKLLSFHVIVGYNTFNSLAKLKVGALLPTLNGKHLARWYSKKSSTVILFRPGDRVKANYALILRANLAVVANKVAVHGIGVVLNPGLKL